MPQAIVMPEMGMYMEEGVLTTWLRPEGARVEFGEPILEITTEKVTFEVPAPAAGILHHAAEVGVSLPVQALLGYVLAEGEALSAASEIDVLSNSARGLSPHSSQPTLEVSRAAGPPKASPAARRLATQHGIDLNLVKGSGPRGRIVESDVLAKVSQQQT